MSKKKSHGKKKKAQSQAAWNLTVLFIVFGSFYFGVLWWARNDSKSDVASQIRDLLGIVLVNQPAPPAPPPPPPPPPPPVIEPQPVIVAEPPPPPEPTELEWSAFKRQPNMWPDALDIMIEREITLTFRGNSYGEVAFNPGQVLNVSSFSNNGFVNGRVAGNEMEVHVSATNFASWFENTHGSQHYMSYPEKAQIRQSEDFETELITNLRIWSMQNYNTPLIEIQENNLVLRLHPKSRDEVNADYSPEAKGVARAYLRIQAEIGGTDNYASCEIRDSDTGALLGSSGLFVPRF